MRVQQDVRVEGILSARTLVPSAECVFDIHVAATAAIATIKMLHKHLKRVSQSGIAVAETRAIHVVIGATGTLKYFRVGSIEPCTGVAEITIDLLKNGVSILTAPVVLTSSDTGRVDKETNFIITPVLVGDWFEVVITVAAGGDTLGSGVACELEIDEDPT